MVWLARFFCRSNIVSVSSSLSTTDNSCRTEVVVCWHCYRDVAPPYCPTARKICQGTDMRGAVFLHSPEIIIVDRIDTRRAVIAPSVARGSDIRLLLPITILTRFESALYLHSVRNIGERPESIVCADVLIR